MAGERESPVADCRVFTVTARTCTRAGVPGETTFYRLDSVDWVNVIAVTTGERVVLIRQWRYGAAGPILENPGGNRLHTFLPHATRSRPRDSITPIARRPCGRGGDWISLPD